MWVLGAVLLFATNLVWRLTRWSACGHLLVRALGWEEENLRTIAGMFLVQAGRTAEPLLAIALERRENLPIVLAILGDIGDRSLEPQLQQFSSDADPDVAKAARDALRVLAAHH